MDGLPGDSGLIRLDLPSYLTSFVGREAELAAVRESLRDSRVRLLTLTGPGGVGKTRLAVEAARGIGAGEADLVAFFPLAALRGHGLVLPTVARRLAPAAGDDGPLAVVAAALAGRRAVMVLDNLERLLAVAPSLAALLSAEGCGGLTLLATSRARLGIDGEEVHALAPLAPPGEDVADGSGDRTWENESVRLFVARARAAHAGPRPARTAADAAIVAEICRRTEGLPLAIELAAARTRTISLEALLARLTRPLAILGGGPADGDPRHRALRDAIAWSHDPLTPEQQALFRRLAVFTGGVSLEMAERIARGREPGAGYPFAEGYGLDYPLAPHLGYDPCPTEGDPELPARAAGLPPIPGDPIDALAALVDQSLIRRVDAADGETRYELLESIREFGLEQLAERGETEAARHAHMALMLAFAEAGGEGIFIRRRRLWGIERYDAELGNLRSALEWLARQGPAMADLQLRLPDRLCVYWQIRGMPAEGRGWLERALAGGGGSALRRITATNALGWLCWIGGDDGAAEAALIRALALAAEIPPGSTQAMTHFYLALVCWRQGRAAEMAGHLADALPVYRACEDWIGEGVCLLALAEMARLGGDPGVAVARCAAAFALHDKGGYEWGMATARYLSAEAHRDLGMLPDAAALLAEALRRYWAEGDLWGSGACLAGIACLAAGREKWEAAGRLFGASAAICERARALLPPTGEAHRRQVAASVQVAVGPGPFVDGRALAAVPALAVAEALAVADRMADAGAGAGPPAPPKALTRMQREVVRWYACGLEPKKIVEPLNRSLGTVYGHLKAVRILLGCATYQELRARALELGLDRAPEPAPAKPRRRRKASPPPTP